MIQQMGGSSSNPSQPSPSPPSHLLLAILLFCSSPELFPHSRESHFASSPTKKLRQTRARQMDYLRQLRWFAA